MRCTHLLPGEHLSEYGSDGLQVSLEQNPADFVEATLFTEEEGVVMRGNFEDSPDTCNGAVNNCNW